MSHTFPSSISYRLPDYLCLTTLALGVHSNTSQDSRSVAVHMNISSTFSTRISLSVTHLYITSPRLHFVMDVRIGILK